MTFGSTSKLGQRNLAVWFPPFASSHVSDAVSAIPQLITLSQHFTTFVSIVAILCFIASFGYGIWKYQTIVQARAQRNIIDFAKSMGTSFSTGGHHGPQQISIFPLFLKN